MSITQWIVSGDFIKKKKKKQIVEGKSASKWKINCVETKCFVWILLLLYVSNLSTFLFELYKAVMKEMSICRQILPHFTYSQKLLIFK